MHLYLSLFLYQPLTLFLDLTTALSNSISLPNYFDISFYFCNSVYLFLGLTISLTLFLYLFLFLHLTLFMYLLSIKPPIYPLPPYDRYRQRRWLGSFQTCPGQWRRRDEAASALCRCGRGRLRSGGGSRRPRLASPRPPLARSPGAGRDRWARWLIGGSWKVGWPNDYLVSWRGCLNRVAVG